MVSGIGRGRVIDRRPERGDGTYRSLSRGKNFRSRTMNAELLNLKAAETAMYLPRTGARRGRRRRGKMRFATRKHNIPDIREMRFS